MKKLKVVILSALVMTGLAGCGGEKEPEHQHTFSTEWTSDATQHWHAATCEHADQKSDVANHSDTNHDGKCDVCAKEGLEVKHTDSGNGYCSCGLKIKVESVELDTSSAKLVYALGEELDTTGVKLTATYTDGSTAEISFTATADLSTVGSKVVTLEYNTEDETGSKATKTYNVTVSYWSEEDLGVIEECTMPGWFGLDIPYMPGMKIDYTLDENEEIESWNVLKENASSDDLLEYKELLTLYEGSYFDEEEEVTLNFEFTELTDFSEDELAFIEEEYGFAEGDFVAFCMSPWYLDDDLQSRAYYVDEYFIVGINSDSELKVFDRFVSAYFETYFSGYGTVNGDGFNVAALVAAKYTADYFIEAVSDVPYFFGSEFAEDYIGMPSFENEEGYVFFTSYKGVCPFDPYYDDLLMSVQVDYINGTQTSYEEFITDLVKLGYVKTEGKNVYTLERPYLGSVSYSFYPYSDTFCDEFYGAGAGEYYGFNNGFAVLLEYEAPGEEYVTKLLPEAERVVEALGFGEDAYYEGSNRSFEEYASFYIFKDEEELNPQAILAGLVSKLPTDYYMDGDADYDEDYECYYAYFTNGYTAFEMDVYDPDEDGDVYVELAFSEGYDILPTYVNKVAAFAVENDFPIQGAPYGDGFMLQTAVPVSEAEKGGIESLADAANYIVNAYVSFSELVAAPTTEPVVSTTITVTTKSVDGNYDLVFTFSLQNIEALGGDCYVCTIYIEESAPWTGTAEEGFLKVMENLEIPEAYWEYAKTVGYLTWYGEVPVSYMGDALNATLNDIVSALPKGVVYVGSPETNTFYFQSADGSVTFIIVVKAYYEDETHQTICTSFSVNVIATPAE